MPADGAKIFFQLSVDTGAAARVAAETAAGGAFGEYERRARNLVSMIPREIAETAMETPRIPWYAAFCIPPPSPQI